MDEKILTKKKKFGIKKILGLKKFRSKKSLGPKSLVKIGSVTAEIFMIWTNVTRTDVA